MCHNKKNYPLTTPQICESTEALAWLGDFPQYPVRLSRIGIYRPVRADFQNVSFGDFLALDNLYQGYLQNLTPASRQCVFDLREWLRREKSDASDALLSLLVENGDAQADTLLYTPTLLRRYGVRTKDGAPVYEVELQLVLPDLYAAQHLAENMVGQEQMSELLAGQATFVEDSAESLLVERCRRLMATYLKGANLRLAKHEVQDFLNRYADDLPTYKSSSKYEADQFVPYENKRDDSCFFFS